ncbi:MAG: hypothetical protein HYZ27_03960 [Deltaproteobacteria bacterium]|nr:hypothetical protein [Deltaproteobacteria bacterium]
MDRLVALAVVAVSLGACGGMSREAARREVQQLTVLYQENRPKFVVQKQEMIQAKSCERATALRAAADELVKEAAMSPSKDDTLTLVQMELNQAAKECRAK